MLLLALIAINLALASLAVVFTGIVLLTSRDFIHGFQGNKAYGVEVFVAEYVAAESDMPLKNEKERKKEIA